MKPRPRQIEQMLSVQATCAGASDSLCCGPGVAEAIAGVGRRAETLRSWAFGAPGCHEDLDGRSLDGTWRDTYLAKIVAMARSGGEIQEDA